MTAITLACLCALLFPLTCFASETSSGDDVIARVTIEGEHIVKDNTSLKTGRHTFVLESEDEAAPMPQDSEGSVKSVTISSNNKFSFGEIDYTKQGKYDYTISRQTTQSKDLEEDDSVYRAQVTVFNNGESALVLQEKGKEGKPDKVIYADKYTGDKDTDTNKNKGGKGGKGTQTGDDAHLMLAGMLLIASTMFLVACAGRRDEDE